jgi:hypothetical protein
MVPPAMASALDGQREPADTIRSSTTGTQKPSLVTEQPAGAGKRLIEVPDFEDLSRFSLAIDGGFHVG